MPSLKWRAARFISQVRGLRSSNPSGVRIMYDETPDVFTYVFVRQDMPIANQIVQVGHACFEAGKKFDSPKESCTLILFYVGNEESLLASVERAHLAGVEMHIFYESDYPKGYTAACSQPITGNARRAFEKCKLWR